MNTAVVLINLGTPTSTLPKDVGKYLREFLMDPLVVDIPWFPRWLLVNLFIVPRRKYDSAKLYERIWTEEGSPLLIHLKDLVEKIQTQFTPDTKVWGAMRYNQPSINNVFKEVVAQKPSKILLVPLYPQYSLAATASSLIAAKKVLKKLGYGDKTQVLEDFYSEDWFLDSYADIIRKNLEGFSFDKLIFSYHGLPERQILKTANCGQYCFRSAQCCEKIVEKNAKCYRAQSFHTTKRLVEKLGISKEKCLIGFQSRLGRTPWIRPFTDVYYQELPKKGVKKIAVVCPSFVADCLETLEEVGIRGKQLFLNSGGDELKLIPCLNSEEIWVKSLAQAIRNYQPKT